MSEILFRHRDWWCDHSGSVTGEAGAHNSRDIAGRDAPITMHAVVTGCPRNRECAMLRCTGIRSCPSASSSRSMGWEITPR